MNCPYQCGPDTEGNCLECGQPLGASGCDGGSWVHMSTAPDRVVQTSWCYGRMVEQRLANGVLIRYKNGGVRMETVLAHEAGRVTKGQ
jgi:hypothetical protein